MSNRIHLALLCLSCVVSFDSFASLAANEETGRRGPETKRAITSGPLRVHPDNPRYLADGAGRVVYLTGSHTWSNLVDMGPGDPPPRFDFDAYRDWLEIDEVVISRGPIGLLNEGVDRP